MPKGGKVEMGKTREVEGAGCIYSKYIIRNSQRINHSFKTKIKYLKYSQLFIKLKGKMHMIIN